MKTVSDVSAFVKRNDNFELNILHDGKVFVVKCGEMSTRSAYLDDALENLAEAKRRQANDMQAVRETKAEPSPSTNPFTSTGTQAVTMAALQAAKQAMSGYLGAPSISQAAQQAYQQGQAAQATCTACNGMGYIIRHIGGIGFASTCKCTSPTNGSVMP